MRIIERRKSCGLAKTVISAETARPWRYKKIDRKSRSTCVLCAGVIVDRVLTLKNQKKKLKTDFFFMACFPISVVFLIC